ncbi:MAG: glycosyltransferase [Candidatus Omnitrophica bacterium]|nr:glycosyltransferase [Candidatus Omnitrophota bacterium]
MLTGRPAPSSPMLVSGFTIARNAIKYNYPLLESIRSILPICDEFVVNVGDSEDGTLELIESLKSPKIRIIQNVWDFSMGKEVLSYQTNIALKECRGTWAFYLQSDEMIHEEDLPRLRRMMERNRDNKEVEVFRFKWMHFYGSYYRYRVDHGWFQKQDRIVRNNGEIESEGDAWGFRRKDGQPLRRKNTGCLLYHYGWVHPQEVMADRRRNAENIGFVKLQDDERNQKYSYGDLNRFPPYFGTHPTVMAQRIAEHRLSLEDQMVIKKKYWWHPFQVFHVRCKTSRRVKRPIEETIPKP